MANAGTSTSQWYWSCVNSNEHRSAIEVNDTLVSDFPALLGEAGIEVTNYIRNARIQPVLSYKSLNKIGLEIYSPNYGMFGCTIH